ncbi:hypothetical protein PRZ48_009813 [Zasmidium cellare]|uniref:MOSC domain-containing protein n=1 Tax=Zasmidium cellare TaxID=395010 RepID=A0ABR0EDD7_ZASCE|nr:hypothetical protein PRZ48_009813 [Zasmidium cellare]
MAQTTFFNHYINFLMSPAGALALLFVIPLVFYVYTEARRRNTRSGSRIQGCLRIGLQGKSYLEGQYNSVASQDQTPIVKSLFVYPVKSCRGVELSVSTVTGTGLKYDRLFSFAQLVSSKKQASANSEGISEVNSEVTHQWRFITQREVPRLALLSTELWVPDHRTAGGQQSTRLDSKLANGSSPSGLTYRKGHATENGGHRAEEAPQKQELVDPIKDWSASGGCLVVRFPYEKSGSIFGTTTESVTIKIPLQPSPERAKSKRYTYESMAIWKDCPESINLSNEIEPESLAKLKYFLGVSNPLALFRVDDDNLRAVTRGLPKDRPDEKFKVGFADAFPVHLLNIASVRAVDDSLPGEAKAKGTLDARRFRANIYVSGPVAFAEDRWMRITAGHKRIAQGKAGVAEYHAACRTARCTLPNVHPDSGLKDRNEPHSTLKRTRQVDEGAKPHPCLGLSMIPLFQDGVIRCGDKIEVLEEGEHVYEKMFK